MATRLAEPSPRFLHFYTSVAGRGYLYGGHTNQLEKEKVEVSSKVLVFDPYLESWSDKSPQGPHPSGLYDGTCTSAGNDIYLYGGRDGTNYQGSLHRLNLANMTWTQLSSTGPMKKAGCEIVIYENHLILFGGHGVPSGPIQPGSEFIKSKGDKGWSNELHSFDLKKGTWSSPSTSGRKPPPCSNFSFTMIDDHRAVLFGGYQGNGRGETNDVYILDLTRMRWSKLENFSGEPCPVRRQYHAAVCLEYNGDNPQILITGGLDNNCKILSDTWILNVDSRRWIEVKETLPLSRYGHSATTCTLSPGLTEVTLFGGKTKKFPARKYPGSHIANTTLLKFEYMKQTGDWKLVDMADNSQLGKAERVGMKKEKIVHHECNKQTDEPEVVDLEDKSQMERVQMKREEIVQHECNKQTDKPDLEDKGQVERVQMKREEIVQHVSPVYSFPGLLRGALNVVEGSDVEVFFEVAPLLKNRKHILTREGVPVLDGRVNIGENAVHFASIRREDAGKYTITSNGIGERRGSFSLTVSGPPQYILDDDYVKARAGESPTLHFTVTSDSPLPDDTKHSIHNEDGKLIRRFKASSNLITFRDVEVSDSGEYTISCLDCKGLQGKATIELKITPPDATSIAINSQQSYDNDTMKSPDHTHQTKRSPSITQPLPLQMRYLQLIKWKGPQGEVHKYELIEKVSAGWRKFGTRINLSTNIMDCWHGETQASANLCWERVMQAWLDGQGQDEYPLTWDGLFEMLEDVKYAGVVPSLKEAIEGASPNCHGLFTYL